MQVAREPLEQVLQEEHGMGETEVRWRLGFGAMLGAAPSEAAHRVGGPAFSGYWAVATNAATGGGSLLREYVQV